MFFDIETELRIFQGNGPIAMKHFEKCFTNLFSNNSMERGSVGVGAGAFPQNKLPENISLGCGQPGFELSRKLSLVQR